MIKFTKKQMKKTLLCIGIILIIIFLLTNVNKNNNPKFTIIHDNLERHYQIHIPKNYNKSKTPLVIYLHGGGGNINAAYQDGLDKMSDKYNFILAIPEGTGEKKLGNIRASWNGGKWETGECCGKADDIGFILKMINEIKNNFNINDQKIYVTGISNGGLMANRVACELSDEITAIATIAPTAIISDCNPTKPISIMDIHGTADPVNPINKEEPNISVFNMPYKRMTPYQIIEKWKKINSCSNNKIIKEKNNNTKCIIYNECKNNSKVQLCIVKNMGHTYPNGSQYLPSSIIGPVSEDISFKEIWEFFEASN